MLAKASSRANAARSVDWLLILALIVTAGTVWLVGTAVAESLPLLPFGGTEQDREAIRAARTVLPIRMIFVLGAASLFLLRRRWTTSVIIASSAVVPTVLVYALPNTVLSLWAYWIFAPAAVGAAVVAVVRGRGSQPSPGE